VVLYDRGLPALIEPGEGGSGAECLHPRPEQVARERAQRAHVRVVGHVRRIARRTGLAHLRNRHAQIYFHTVQLSILHGTERSIVCAPLIHGNDQAVLPVACDTGVLAVRRKQPIGVAPSAAGRPSLTRYPTQPLPVRLPRSGPLPEPLARQLLALTRRCDGDFVPPLSWRHRLGQELRDLGPQALSSERRLRT